MVKVVLVTKEPVTALVEDPIPPELATQAYAESLRRVCRTRQTLMYVKRQSRGRPELLPPKFFTKALGAVKVPSFSKGYEEPYALFGLALEESLLPFFAKVGYQIVGAESGCEEAISKNFPFLNWERHQESIVANLKATAKAVAEAYPVYLFPTLEYQTELSLRGDSEVGIGPLQCHPDFVLKSSEGKKVVILECKFISYMPASKGWAYRAQLATYLGAYREAGYQVVSAAFVLPWERDPRVVEVPTINKYNHVPLLGLVLDARFLVAEEPIQAARWTRMYVDYAIGHHIRVANLEAHLSNPPDFPVQIFFGGMTTNPASDLKIHAKYRGHYDFSRGPRRIHIHGPYNLLLTGPPYVREAILEYLKTAHSVKASSVVFHIGTGKTYSEGLKALRGNLKYITSAYARYLGDAVEGTYPKLLLETGAGKGIEPTPNPETMARELARYDPRVLGVCVDTCHVHDAGFSPPEYVQRYLDHYQTYRPGPARVDLFHFNGSSYPRGSCVDKHSALKYAQHIPWEELQWIVGYADANQVDLVTE